MEEKATIGELTRKSIGKAALITGLLVLVGTALSGCATTEYYTGSSYNSNASYDTVRMNRDATNNLIRIANY